MYSGGNPFCRRERVSKSGDMDKNTHKVERGRLCISVSYGKISGVFSDWGKTFGGRDVYRWLSCGFPANGYQTDSLL